jgi:hypothetical protein
MGLDNNRTIRTKKDPVKRNHVNEGFPHFSSKFPYHCMCLDTCCHGEGGCKCKTCVCKSHGIEHGSSVAGTQQGEEESEARPEQSEV